ncbi:hypothetical protein ACLEYI_13580 [Enterobacter ludwigii]|uniref:hypothetical protein n=1 Tax=Enterobacter ludwigii TaxID=299767 RepID=UPI0039761C3F
MMTDEKKEKASFPAGLGIMDKIWEWQWIIRFIYIVLFADLALLVYSGQGILTWPVQTLNWTEHLGFFCVALAALGLIATTLMPFIANIVRLLLNELIYSSIFPDFLRAQSDYQKRSGEVPSGEVLDLALKENNQFLLKYYEKHNANWRTKFHERFKVGDLLFGILFFMMLDDHPQWFSDAQHSLVIDLFSHGGESGTVLFYTVLIIIFSTLMSLWFGKWDWGNIYYPPLYREKEEARRKAREREAQWEQQDR